LALIVGRPVLVGADDGAVEGEIEIVGTDVMVGNIDRVGGALGAGVGASVSVG